MFFFRELALLIEKASNRPDCSRLKRELRNSLNWVYFKAMLKDDIKDTSALLCDPKVYRWKRVIKSCIVGGPDQPDDPGLVVIFDIFIFFATLQCLFFLSFLIVH